MDDRVLSMTLTDARVPSSDEDDLIGEVPTLQDLESGGVSVVPFGLHRHVLHRERLAWVEVGGPLVDVAVNGRRMRERRQRETGTQVCFHLLHIDHLTLVVGFLLPAIR